jgi:monofunctional biosynthetic peptidoglycan transglycosylase
VFKRFLILALFFLLAAAEITLVQVMMLRLHDPQVTAWMRLRQRQALAQNKSLEIHHTWLSLPVIPKTMQRAVIAAEDDRFYQHHGFDWDAIQKALERNEEIGKVKRGGSTITQQLAKNLYLSPHRSYWRKFREACYTVVLEWILAKDRILELYLNSIEFGPGVFGVEEAARYHFHSSARQLTLDQSCRLAAIIPSPLRYKVTGNYVSNRARNIAQIIGGPTAVQ